jgi:hypothetical protein
MWPKKKRRKPKFASITTVSQIKLHLREFLLDSQLPNAIEVSEKMGCAVVSDEVLDHEMDMSEVRLNNIQHLLPLLYGYSAVMAEAFVDSLTDSLPEETNKELSAAVAKVAHGTQHVMEDVMTSLLMGAVSQLVDLELVKLNGKTK